MVNSRKQFIIDPRFQYRLMGIIISGGIIVCVIFLSALYYFMTKIFSFLENAETLSSDAKVELFVSWNNMLYMLIILVGVSIFGIWLWAKVFTNKIAGPIFNMTTKLDAFIAGDKTARIKLREKDYFSGLAEKINRALDQISQD